MKNQYVGDVNDYVKYAFLRHLMRVGSEVTICWMLTSDDGRTDGNRRGYLETPERYRHHDPELFDALAGHLCQAREIETVEESGILPNARFVSDSLGDEGESRVAYFGRLSSKLGPRSLVFFDPDNGLNVPSVRPGGRNSSKYLFRDELATTLHAGHSAIVYQHFPRVERQRFMRSVFDSVARTEAWQCASVYTSHVAYLLFLQEPHAHLYETAREFAVAWSPKLSYFAPTPNPIS